MPALNRRSLIAAASGFVAAPALAAKLPLSPLNESRDGYTLVVRDLSPRFLDFYAAARSLDPDARFALWKERYDFAALPPVPSSDAMARRLLDAAWPRYEAALPLIRAGFAGMRPRPLDVLVSVGGLFEAPTPMTIGFTAYVGGFEINAFTTANESGVVVAAPIEMDVEHRTLALPHEMTHAVHISISHLSPGYERALGRVVFEEGLAMRAAQRLVPGRPDHDYVGDEPWFSRGLADSPAILKGLAPDLQKSDAGTLIKYTMGSGNTGREREAYLAGWLVVGRLLQEGRTFPELARVPERELPVVVQRTLARMIA